jgi:hypothetical protein
MRDADQVRLDTLHIGSGTLAADAVRAYGHSYVFGIGSSDSGKRFTSVLAEMMRLSENNLAITGSALGSNTSSGGWVAILQEVTRPARGEVSGSGVTASGQPGFSNPTGLIVAMWGINDVNNQGNTAAELAGDQDCLRTVISRFRAGVICEETDSSLAFGSGWTHSASTTQNSGAGFQYTSTNGSTMTITTPADFPGGTVALGFTAETPVGDGATWTAVVNGGASYTKSGYNNQVPGGAYIGQVLRIPNVPAGVNTVVVTGSAISGLAIFDYWQWEASTPDAPLVLLPLQPLPINYSAYGAGGPNGPPTDVGVGVLNSLIEEVADEFDDRVATVDLSSMNHVAADFSTADSLHPSDLGHQVIAGKLQAAVNAKFLNIARGGVLARRKTFAAAANTSTSQYDNVGDICWNTAPAASGNMGWVCVAPGHPGTWKTFGTIGS